MTAYLCVWCLSVAWSDWEAPCDTLCGESWLGTEICAIETNIWSPLPQGLEKREGIRLTVHHMLSTVKTRYIVHVHCLALAFVKLHRLVILTHHHLWLIPFCCACFCLSQRSFHFLLTPPQREVRPLRRQKTTKESRGHLMHTCRHWQSWKKEGKIQTCPFECRYKSLHVLFARFFPWRGRHITRIRASPYMVERCHAPIRGGTQGNQREFPLRQAAAQ